MLSGKIERSLLLLTTVLSLALAASYCGGGGSKKELGVIIDPGGDAPDGTTGPTIQDWSWLTEFSGHPRLIFTAGDIGEIRDKLQRQPYLALYQGMLARQADRPAPPDDARGYPQCFDPYWAYPVANYAKTRAFVALIAESANDLAEAVWAFEQVQDDFSTIAGLDVLSKQVHAASGLVLLAQAYDLLAANPEADDAQISAARRKLENYTASYFDYMTVAFPTYLQFTRNNHNTLFASAIGLAALALSDHERAREWISYAVTELARLDAELYTSDGGYAEGPYYEMYSALHYLPFAAAFRGAIGEQTFSFESTCFHNPDLLGCAAQQITLGDFFADPLWRARFDWGVKIRLPDGRRPSIDDALLAGNFGAIPAGILADPVLVWDWENQFSAADGYTVLPDGSSRFSEWTADLTVDSIAWFDDSLVAVAPNEQPLTVLPESGVAVYRSGFGREDTYLLGLAEHGPANLAGHDQPDNGQLTLVSGGEILLIDPGYISWEDNDLVNHPEHHNLVLVDGEGWPSGVYMGSGAEGAFFVDDEQLVDSADDQPLYFFAMRQQNDGVEWVRRVVVLSESQIVVADALSATATHSYTAMWHGNGIDPEGAIACDEQWAEKSGGYELSFFSSEVTGGVQRAVWRRPGLEVEIALLADALLTTDSAIYCEGYQAFGTANIAHHTGASFTWNGSKTNLVTFIEVGVPGIELDVTVSDDGGLLVDRPDGGTLEIVTSATMGESPLTIIWSDESTAVQRTAYIE